MNKKELISKIAEKENITKKAAGEQLAAIVSTITDAIVGGQEVQITGFGKFSVKDRPAREGRNPQTGESMHIAASKTPKFKPSKALKDAVNA